MFSKKSWYSSGVWKPKNPHSLEHLKYLYNVLCKNQTVSEQNLTLLVETLRSISEILIWGDQNDSSVFDFFLEKNMLLFFLRFMRQKSGRYICTQLLQTLNILFDNISNETSVYYLLSNNHINSIIVHKFDFSDEEVMAYYISFLKTLSLKLNKHTIHFFYNEHTNDFALYTEAIKFFNHSESMVRIAVRTITLNVYNACKTDGGRPIEEGKGLEVSKGVEGSKEVEGGEEDQQTIDNNCMLRYIRDKTAAPYFSNLVWFIGNHVIELDTCVQHDIDHNSRGRLADLVAEHLDHLHYLNDILCLNIDALNEVLTDHLLNRLFIPLYVYSLIDPATTAQIVSSTPNASPLRGEKTSPPRIASIVSLFLLSQVFLIIHYGPLVQQLADIIIAGEPDGCSSSRHNSPHSKTLCGKVRGFLKPTEDLIKTFDTRRSKKHASTVHTGKSKMAAAVSSSSEHGSLARVSEEGSGRSAEVAEVTDVAVDDSISEGVSISETSSEFDISEEALEAADTLPPITASDETPVIEEPPTSVPHVLTNPTNSHISNPNSTDEEKLLQTSGASVVVTVTEIMGNELDDLDLSKRPYWKAILASLDCTDNDYKALFSLCLLYALGHNSGMSQELLDSVLIPTDLSLTKHHYGARLVQQLIQIMSLACQNGSKVRLATLELTILLLSSMVYTEGQCFLQDGHLAAVEGVREEATLLLRSFYKVWEKSEEIFLDMFEDEYRELLNRPLNIEYLTMDASILLPPTGTPLTGIDFTRRLPCGEVERARRAIRVLFMVRKLSFKLRQDIETQLPLTTEEECVKVDDVLDLNNSDLIACTIIVNKDNKKERRFLVIDVIQLILVEPDSKRLGWGVVRFVGFLQDVEVAGDKDDSRCLHITIHKPSMNCSSQGRPLPLLSAHFIFDDHIRCMAAKQRLTKGRLKARQRKMQMIAKLLELPASIVDSMYPGGGGQSGVTGLRSGVQRAGGAVGGRAQGSSKLPGSAIPGRSHVVSSRHTQSAASGATNVNASSSSSLETTTVQRSVFASVDQVPGFTMATKEQEQEPISLVGSRLKMLKPRGGFSAEGAGGLSDAARAEQKQKLLSQAMQVAQRTRQRASENKREGVGDDGGDGGGGTGRTGEQGRKPRSSRSSAEPPGKSDSTGSHKKSEATSTGIPVYRRESPSSTQWGGRRESPCSEQGGRRESPSSVQGGRRLSTEGRTSSSSPSSTYRQKSKADAVVTSEKVGQLDALQSEIGRHDEEDEDVIKMMTKTAGGPKSLKPAEGLHVSLVCDVTANTIRGTHDGLLDSPIKLVPPVNECEKHRFGNLQQETTTTRTTEYELKEQLGAECIRLADVPIPSGTVGCDDVNGEGALRDDVVNDQSAWT